MKNASQLKRKPGKPHSEKNDPHNGASSNTGAAPASSRRKWLFLGLIALTSVFTWALFEFVLWSRVPPELVGEWVVTEGPDEGGTVDFYRGGTMVAKVNNGGMAGIIEGQIRVDDKKIYVTTKHQMTGEEGVRVQTIRSLDADFLVLQDERGTSVRLRRAK